MHAYHTIAESTILKLLRVWLHLTLAREMVDHESHPVGWVRSRVSNRDVYMAFRPPMVSLCERLNDWHA